MTFVVEPGIYVRPQALEGLEDTPENQKFKAGVARAVEKYKGLGVRVEDSFLLTPTGLKNLSATTPRTIDEIERHMKTTRRTSSAAAATPR
jgi:Xaa-Pro aminopeptidase